MNQSTQNHIRDSEHSILSKQESNYQIQPFDIEPKKLTHVKVKQMINHWDSVAKIQQKFPVWSLNFTSDKVLKIVPQQFYNTAIHYVFLKKLQILIKDFDEKQLINMSMELKDIYKVQSLKGKFKGRRFDYLVIVTVKLIGFFLGSHTRDIIINQELESQIYTILVFVLLGTQVGQKTYPVLLQKYKKKQTLKYNRTSQIEKYLVLPSLESKKPSDHHKTAKTTAYSKKRIGRTQCRSGTQMFLQPSKVIQDRGYREMKQLLKINLQVKEFIPKPKVKQSLDAVLSKTVDSDTKLNELQVAKSMQKSDMQHKKIFYTQMSSSLDLLRNNNSLNILQNHSLNIKPQKQAKFFQLKSKDDILKSSKSAQNLNQKFPKIQKPLVSPQVYSYQAIVLKKKQPTYWKKVINKMKQNHYENIQHFPPISAKMYFQPGQLDDQVKRQSFANSNMGKNQNIPFQEHYHGEYLTEKVVEMPMKMIKQISINQTQNRLSNNLFVQNLNKKSSIRTKSVHEEPKGQVNIVQYSKIANDSEVFKTQKGFLNVYSNKPIDDLGSKLKKKSYQQIKEMQKKFYQDCKIRQQKIQESYSC